MEVVKRVVSIEQTVYGKMAADGKNIRVVTKTGWQSDVCKPELEALYPGGIFVTKGAVSPTNRYFVPFDSIDHVQIF